MWICTYWKNKKQEIQSLFFRPTGCTIGDCADYYGVSRQRMSQIIKDNDIKIIKRAEAICISIRKYLDKDYSPEQIANKLSLSHNVVNNYIRRYRIPHLSYAKKIQIYLERQGDPKLYWLYSTLKYRRKITGPERLEMLLKMYLPKYCPLTFQELDYSSSKRGYKDDKPCLVIFNPNGRTNYYNTSILSMLGARIPKHGFFEDMEMYEEWMRDEIDERNDDRHGDKYK